MQDTMKPVHNKTFRWQGLVSWQHIKVKSSRMKQQKHICCSYKVVIVGIALCNHGPSHHTRQHRFIWMSHWHTHTIFVNTFPLCFRLMQCSSCRDSTCNIALFHSLPSVPPQSPDGVTITKTWVVFLPIPLTAEAGTWMACHILYAEEQATQGRWLYYHVCWMDIKC